jgi:aspartate/methionine/tyrosine aminotransferase
MGVAPPDPVQAASVVAWQDVNHVEERRSLFAEKRRILLEHFRATGLRAFPGSATLFLWIEVPADRTDVEYANELLDHGIVVSPGSFFGAGQERFFRVAMVPSVEECRAAVAAWPR